MRASLQEAVLLSTCNRTEVYAVVEDEGARARVLDLLAEDRGVERASLDEDTYWLTDAEAVRHLYRVASSLDSMVVGEGQILGQVRDAYRAATEEQCTGPVLNRLFHTSLRVGKRVRSETGIGDSSLSVPHVAVKLAEERLRDARRAAGAGARCRRHERARRQAPQERGRRGRADRQPHPGARRHGSPSASAAGRSRFDELAGRAGRGRRRRQLHGLGGVGGRAASRSRTALARTGRIPSSSWTSRCRGTWTPWCRPWSGRLPLRHRRPAGRGRAQRRRIGARRRRRGRP